MINELIAPEGMYYTNGEVYGTHICLSILDSEENWRLITEEEKNEMFPEEETKEEN